MTESSSLSASLAQRLSSVNSTTESITSIWKFISATKLPSQLVCDVWEDQLKSHLPGDQQQQQQLQSSSSSTTTTTSEERTILLVYVCNDILQESLKTSQEFVRAFSRILRRAFRGICLSPLRLTPGLMRVIGVWEARKVLQQKLIDELRKIIDDPTTNAVNDEDLNQDDLAAFGNAAAAGNNNNSNKRFRSSSDSSVFVAQSPAEELKQNLKPFGLSNLLGLLDWVNNEIDVTPEFSNQDKELCNSLVAEAKDTVANPQLTSAAQLRQLSSRINLKLEKLKARRRALGASTPIREALRNAVEQTIQTVERELPNGDKEVTAYESMETALKKLVDHNIRGKIDGRYKSIRLVPKVVRTQKALVVDGPDLTFAKERKLREGLTAEEAAKSSVPVVYNKALDRYVPLPTGDQTDYWRN